MFFKSLFSKKRVVEPERVELKLEEVETWLRKENKEFTDSLEGDIQESYANLGERLSGLKETFSHFRKSTIHPDVLERLKKAAQTNKLTIEKDLDNFMGSFSIPQEKDFLTAYDFCESLSRRIVEFGKKNRRGFLILREALRDDTTSLRKGIGELESEVLEFWKMLKERGKRVKEIEELVSLSKSVRSDIEREPEFENKIKSMESALDFQRQKMETARKEIEDAANSREMSRLKEMEKNIQELKTKKKELEERIIREMSHFEKALKKMAHEKNENSEMIKRYLENPLAITDSQGLGEFKSLIPPLKQGMESFGLSDKAKEKAFTGIERLESGVLDWNIKEQKEIEAKISGLSKKINRNKVTEEKREKEREMEDWVQAVSSTQKKIKDMKAEKEAIGANIEKQRKMLEDRISALSEKKISVI
jgi:hypothetical protein